MEQRFGMASTPRAQYSTVPAEARGLKLPENREFYRLEQGIFIPESRHVDSTLSPAGYYYTSIQSEKKLSTVLLLRVPALRISLRSTLRRRADRRLSRWSYPDATFDVVVEIFNASRSAMAARIWVAQPGLILPPKIN
jgi:hypothetical protein